MLRDLILLHKTLADFVETLQQGLFAARVNLEMVNFTIRGG
jgi:hypothetical protein